MALPPPAHPRVTHAVRQHKGRITISTLLELKPRRLNHLLQILAFALALGILISLVSIVLYRDVYVSFGGIIGLLLGTPLVWAYDDLTKYKRLVITLTDKAIVFPGPWFTTNILPLADLDAARTFTYNSENNFRNQNRYTFWSKYGSSFVIGKYLYGQAQINALLKEIENLQSQEHTR